MKRLKQLLEKLKMYINKLLKKEPILLLENNNEKHPKLIHDNNSTEEIKDIKEEFFELYQNVKEGNIAIENLMINDLIKIMSMMKQEIDIYDKKIEKGKIENLNMKAEIKMLERENETMKKSSGTDITK